MSSAWAAPQPVCDRFTIDSSLSVQGLGSVRLPRGFVADLMVSANGRSVHKHSVSWRFTTAKLVPDATGVSVTMGPSTRFIFVDVTARKYRKQFLREATVEGASWTRRAYTPRNNIDLFTETFKSNWYAVAIDRNRGLRVSIGDFSLVCSPESALDAVATIAESVRPDDAAIAQLVADEEERESVRLAREKLNVKATQALIARDLYNGRIQDGKVVRLANGGFLLRTADMIGGAYGIMLPVGTVAARDAGQHAGRLAIDQSRVVRDMRLGPNAEQTAMNGDPAVGLIALWLDGSGDPADRDLQESRVDLYPEMEEEPGPLFVAAQKTLKPGIVSLWRIVWIEGTSPDQIQRFIAGSRLIQQRALEGRAIWRERREK